MVEVYKSLIRVDPSALDSPVDIPVTSLAKLLYQGSIKNTVVGNLTIGKYKELGPLGFSCGDCADALRVLKDLAERRAQKYRIVTSRGVEEAGAVHAIP